MREFEERVELKKIKILKNQSILYYEFLFFIFLYGLR